MNTEFDGVTLLQVDNFKIKEIEISCRCLFWKQIKLHAGNIYWARLQLGVHVEIGRISKLQH
jgi:hypothetical protein